MDKKFKQTEENLKDKEAANSQDLNEMESLKKQIKEEKNKYLLSLADLENSRKRLQREKQDTIRFAVENIIKEFLSPLDNFENALSFIHQASKETQNWAKGFEMILAQFKEILNHHKVTPFPSEGHLFDPHLHEVLEIEETEKYEDGRIIQEFLKGYKCGERVLRPARVKVAKAFAKNDEEKDLNKKEINHGENSI